MLSRRSALGLGLHLGVGLGLAAATRRAHAAGLLPVVASFSILADLVRDVGGSRVSVASVVPVGTELHSFQPRPSDVRGIGSAAVFVINGLGLEGWAERLAEAAQFKGKGVVATRGVQALRAAHNHGAHGGKEHEHHHGAYDPHAWQDVANVRIYVANIRDGLTAADPDGAAAYAAQADATLRRLDALDQEIRAAIAPIPRERRRIVTTHEAFNYYADAYNIDLLAAQGLSPDAEPTPREFAALIAQIKRENVRALFLEQSMSPRLMEQLSRETKVRIGGTLYADTLSPPDGPAATYVDLMRSNTRTIVTALE